MGKKKTRSVVAVQNKRPSSLFAISAESVQSDRYWRWGDDNMMPYALSLMSRRSTTHRRIINDKADYIAGKGFSFNDEEPLLRQLVGRANGAGDSLREVVCRLAFDKALMGNAFLEVVTDQEHSFLSLYHQDASRCRLARDNEHVILHHNWQSFHDDEASTLPLYPRFEKQADGSLRSVVHYKEYEPMF